MQGHFKWMEKEIVRAQMLIWSLSLEILEADADMRIFHGLNLKAVCVFVGLWVGSSFKPQLAIEQVPSVP